MFSYRSWKKTSFLQLKFLYNCYNNSYYKKDLIDQYFTTIDTNECKNVYSKFVKRLELN